MKSLFAFILVLLLLPAFALAAPFNPERLVAAALAQTAYTRGYDGSYRKLSYPGGDVARETGVCSDVVIRAYRALGVDLQVLVHDDMKKHFSLYPRQWGLSSPDTNIDHRRVPNLQVFFVRHGQSLAVTDKPEDYKPGDLVTWDLSWPGRPLPHIGIVTSMTSESGTPLVVQNIGRGVTIDNTLFTYKITGHYRYAPATGG